MTTESTNETDETDDLGTESENEQEKPLEEESERCRPEGSDDSVEELEESSEEKSKKKTYVMVSLLVVAVVVAFGFFGQMLGAGWFFYRTIMYSSGELYALNLGEKPLWISVDGRPSLEVNPNDARIVRLIGGTSSVAVRDAEHGPVEKTYTITANHSDAFLKLTQEGCLVSVDLDPYYGKSNQKRGGSRNEKSIEDIHFTDKIKKEDQIWIPNSYNVIWPRKTFPKRLSAGDGPGRWIELVACSLLNDNEDDRKFLNAYIALRLQERMEKALHPPKQGPVRNNL